MIISPPPHLPTVRVVAGIVSRNGRILIAQRPVGDDLAGFWEFPGGKIEPGETPAQTLARELDEELAIQVRVGVQLGVSQHRQGDRIIELLALRARWLSGTLCPIAHQAVTWASPDALDADVFAPADRTFVESIRSGAWEI